MGGALGGGGVGGALVLGGVRVRGDARLVDADQVVAAGGPLAHQAQGGEVVRVGRGVGAAQDRPT